MKPKPIRILQVVGSMNAGGVETWLMHVLRTIDRDRFQIDFLVHNNQHHFYEDEIRSLGARLIPCLGLAQPYQPWIYNRNLRKILGDGAYHIVHSQVYLFDGLVLHLAHQEKVPVRISHIHPLQDIKNNDLPRQLYRWLMTKWIAQSATHILCPSHSSLKAFQEICDCTGKYTHILYNGVDLKQFERSFNSDDSKAVRQKFGLPTDKPLVIYVARFAPHKNHAQLLRLADRFNQDRVNVQFVLVGSNGELLESLKQKIGDRSDVVMIAGVRDISDLLSASDLFFFPSLEEGFGVVAIEAAAAGLPIVATNLPTLKEACPPSHHPFMFPPNQDEEAYQNIKTILSDRELKKQLSEDAKAWAENFSIEQSINQLITVYEMCQNSPNLNLDKSEKLYSNLQSINS